VTSEVSLGDIYVDLRGVGKTFWSQRGDVAALKGIDLQIHPGEFLSVVGPSGCGKSTMLRCIAGLEPTTGGTIEIHGKRVTGPPDNLGIVFQRDVLLDWRTVMDNVLLPIEFRRAEKERYRPRANELLVLFGLDGFQARYPWELSGGMRQRVAIARALASDPKILLMDEPFGALDEITRDRLNEEIRRVWKDTGVTILFVTHSIHEAAFLGQRVLMLAANPGRVREIVPVDLPEDRTLDIRETPEFVRLTAHLRRVLETC